MTPVQQLKLLTKKESTSVFSRTLPPERAKEFNVEILITIGLRLPFPANTPCSRKPDRPKGPFQPNHLFNSIVKAPQACLMKPSHLPSRRLFAQCHPGPELLSR